MGHEVPQQCELLGGEIELDAGPTRGVLRRVQREVADAEHRIGLLAVTAEERADPGLELSQRERLHQVVVSTVVEPGHTIVETVSGGQHEHPNGGSDVRADPSTDLEPVDIGHGEIEAHQVIRVEPHHLECGVSAIGDVDRIALFPEAPCHGVGQLGFVIDNKQPHVGHGTDSERRPQGRSSGLNAHRPGAARIVAGAFVASRHRPWDRRAKDQRNQPNRSPLRREQERQT